MIFVDTWAWLALAYARDAYHDRAAQQHQQFRRQKQRYVTTDFVLSEFISALFGALPFGPARHFTDNSVPSGRVRPASACLRFPGTVPQGLPDAAEIPRQA